MKAYLLVFDSSQATRDQVIRVVDRLAGIVNWHAFFDNTLCLASEEDAKSLSQSLRSEFPKLRFLITEVEPDSKAGWLPKAIWEFLNQPRPAPSKTEDA